MRTSAPLVAAAMCFAGCGVLGKALAQPLPLALDAWGVTLRGRAVPLAAGFTALGRSPAIVLVTAGAGLIALASGRTARPLALLFAGQLGAQAAVAVLKRRYRRARPAARLGRVDPDHSYPSGHAATAVVFYGGLLAWTAQLRSAPQPVSALCRMALAACCLGLPWSRLALGAHYATDVAGGLLFGAGCSCAFLALGATTGRT